MATERAGFCGEMAEPLDSCLTMLPIDRLISHVFWKLGEHQTCICAFADGIMALSESISHAPTAYILFDVLGTPQTLLPNLEP
jgi:hypothetical protein